MMIEEAVFREEVRRRMPQFIEELGRAGYGRMCQICPDKFVSIVHDDPVMLTAAFFEGL
jgi:hypothetical protein